VASKGPFQPKAFYDSKSQRGSRGAYRVCEIAGGGTCIRRLGRSAWAQSHTNEAAGPPGWSWLAPGCLAAQAKLCLSVPVWWFASE